MPEYTDMKMAGEKFSTTMALADFIQNRDWKEGAYDVVNNIQSPVQDLSTLTGMQSMWLLTKEALEEIGSDIYSKTHNFVSSNIDVFNCRPEALVSLSKAVGMTNVGIPDVSGYPDEISRLVEVFSIPPFKLLSHPILETCSTDSLYDTTYELVSAQSITCSVIQGKFPPAATSFDIPSPTCAGTFSIEFTSLYLTRSLEVAAREIDSSGYTLPADLVSTTISVSSGERTAGCQSFFTCGSFPACGIRISVSGLVDNVSALVTFTPAASPTTPEYTRVYSIVPAPVGTSSAWSLPGDLYGMDTVKLSAECSQFLVEVRNYHVLAGCSTIDSSVQASLCGTGSGESTGSGLVWKSNRAGCNVWISTFQNIPSTVSISNLSTGKTESGIPFIAYSDGSYRALAADLGVSTGDVISSSISFTAPQDDQVFYDLVMDSSTILSATMAGAYGFSTLSWTSTAPSGKAMMEIGGFPEGDEVSVSSEVRRMKGVVSSRIPSTTYCSLTFSQDGITDPAGMMLMEGYSQCAPCTLGWPSDYYETDVVSRRNFGILVADMEKYWKMVESMFENCLSDNLDQSGLFSSLLEKIYVEKLPRDFLYTIEEDRTESEEMKLKFGVPQWFSAKAETNKVLDQERTIESYSQAEALIIRNEIDFRFSTQSKYGLDKATYRYGEYEKERKLKRYARFVEHFNQEGPEQVVETFGGYDVVNSREPGVRPYGSVFNYVELSPGGEWTVVDDPGYDPTTGQVDMGIAVAPDMVKATSRKLREICISIARQRDVARNAVLRHVMRGTPSGLISGVSDYLGYEFSDYQNLTGVSLEAPGFASCSNSGSAQSYRVPGGLSLGTVEIVEYIDKTPYFNVCCSGTGRYWESAAARASSSSTCSDIEKFHQTRGLQGMTACEIDGMYSRFFQAFTTDTTSTDLMNGIIRETPDCSFFTGCGTTVMCMMLTKYSGCGSVNKSFFSNLFNGTYPSGAPAPYLWNLVPAVERASAISTVFMSAPQSVTELVERISCGDVFGPEGNAIDMWKVENRTFSDLRSKYEYSQKYDKSYRQNRNIDFDSPFNMYALEEFLLIKKMHGDKTESEVKELLGIFYDIWYAGRNVRGMGSDTAFVSPENLYYNTVILNCPKRNFREEAYGLDLGLPASRKTTIVERLYSFIDDIVGLAGMVIFQFATDRSSNRYFLFKSPAASSGAVWMRMADHPMAFPMLDMDESGLSALTSMDVSATYPSSFRSNVATRCVDFGIYRLPTQDFAWFHTMSATGVYLTYYSTIDRTQSIEFPFKVSTLNNNFSFRPYSPGQRHIGFMEMGNVISGETVVHATLDSFAGSKATGWSAAVRFDSFSEDGTFLSKVYRLSLDRDWLFSDQDSYPERSWTMSNKTDLLTMVYEFPPPQDFSGVSTCTLSGFGGYGNYHPAYTRIPNPAESGIAQVEFDVGTMSRVPTSPRVSYHYHSSDLSYRGIFGYQGYLMCEVLSPTCFFLNNIDIPVESAMQIPTSGTIGIQFMGISDPQTPAKIRITDCSTQADFDMFMGSTPNEDLYIKVPNARAFSRWRDHSVYHLCAAPSISFETETSGLPGGNYFSSPLTASLWSPSPDCNTPLPMPTGPECAGWRTGPTQTNAYCGLFNWGTYVSPETKQSLYMDFSNCVTVIRLKENSYWNSAWSLRSANDPYSVEPDTMMRWSTRIAQEGFVMKNIGDQEDIIVSLASGGYAHYHLTLEGVDCYRIRMRRVSHVDTLDLSDNSQPLAGERFVRTVHFSTFCSVSGRQAVIADVSHDYDPQSFWPGKRVRVYQNTSCSLIPLCRTSPERGKVSVCALWDGSGMVETLLHPTPLTIRSVTSDGYAEIDFSPVAISSWEKVLCTTNTGYFSLVQADLF